MILNATDSTLGILAVWIFTFAYILVVANEFTHLRRCKPVMLSAGLIWILVALIAKQSNSQQLVEIAIKDNLQEYGELLLFLLVAMTYVNVMQHFKVFDALRDWLIKNNFTLKKLFWVTGILSFFLSPIVDNLTTALIMCAVTIAAAQNHKKFIALSCINIVVAANSGGVYSPFGDITTLMVWQSGVLDFSEFFKIFIPAAVSYLVPAFFMSLFIRNNNSPAQEVTIKLMPGARLVIIFFALTIFTAVFCKAYLDLPPVIGMMMGLTYVQFYSYYLKVFKNSKHAYFDFDIMQQIEKLEWDTLLFFYGIMLSVGGLATIGYMEAISNYMYTDLGTAVYGVEPATVANTLLGFISAVVGNIPVIYAVLTMAPDLSHGQWLLVTLTAGIGGSILSIGSAAGVALMGQSRGAYTFFTHLRWAPAIILGYFAAVLVHMWLNSALF